MNTRRRLLIVLGTAAYAPQALIGQTTRQPLLIGWLSPGTRAGNALYLAAFKEGMAGLGWKEGAMYVLHERWADGQIARLPTFADEIAAYKPALIVAAMVPAARAVAKVAPNTPIVLIGGDPVSARLVTSYAQPGGMITGIVTANTEISEKFVELLVTAAPNVRRVGFLISRNAANFHLLQENARRSAAQYKVETRFADMSRPDEIEPAFVQLGERKRTGADYDRRRGVRPPAHREIRTESALAARWRRGRWPRRRVDQLRCRCGDLPPCGPHHEGRETDGLADRAANDIRVSGQLENG